MSYLLLKGLHVTCAFTSYTLFLLRGIWSLRGSPIMQQRWIKIVPHIVDTLFLASAISLTFTIQSFPFEDDWLTAKLAGVLFYIGLGFISFRCRRNNGIYLPAWLMAQVVFTYIVLVAIQHNPIPFFH